MTPRERFRALLAGQPLDRLLIDVGTSTLTALRPTAAPRPDDGLRYADPVMHLPVLGEDDLAAIGAQTRRCGSCFPGADLDGDETFGDRDGLRWVWAQGEPAPLTHPLADAPFARIARAGRTPLATIDCPPCLWDPDRDHVVVADAPSTGILDTAFRLRGYYELLDDTVERWPVANALFDRATAAILDDYRAMLRPLPADPDLVVYGDDLAYQADLYLSEERFAFFLRPRLTRIFSTIRSLTRAEILFHTCGAALPILKDVVALGVRVINFQPTAVGMDVGTVRRALGRDIVFHGVLDFVTLAEALAQRDRAEVDRIVDGVVTGWPMIAAPADNIPATTSRMDLRRATAFLEALDLPRLLGGDRGTVSAAFEATAVTAGGGPASGFGFRDALDGAVNPHKAFT